MRALIDQEHASYAVTTSLRAQATRGTDIVNEMEPPTEMDELVED